MIRRNTWILLVAFIVLLVAAILLQRSGGLKAEEATATPTLAEQMLLEIQLDAVQRVTVQDSSGRSIAFERVDQGTWKLTAPQEQPADAAKIDPAVTSLASLSVLNPLEAAIDLDVIGLEAPAYTITVGLSEGQPRVIQVGGTTPTGTGYYARLDGGTPVVVSKFGLDALIGLLDNPPVPATETPAPGAATETVSPNSTGTPQPDITGTATAAP